MLLFINVLLYLNLGRLLRTSKYLVFTQFLAYVISMTTIILFGGFTGNVVFGTYVLTLIVTEYLLCRRKWHLHHKYWLLALTLFVVGFAIWLLDASKTLCFNFGLLNGRAVFHYLNAISIYYLYVFYDLNYK